MFRDKAGKWFVDRKNYDIECHSGYPFWRFWVMGCRAFTWFKNSNFYLIAGFLLNGPLSVKALFKRFAPPPFLVEE